MAELQVRGAFDGVLPARVAGQGVSVEVMAEPGIALILEGREAGALEARMLEALTVDLPGGARRVSSGALTLLGVSRGSWMAVGAGGSAFAAEIAGALMGIAHVADQSGAYCVIEISGPRAAEVLAKGLPLDLHESVFAADAVAVSRIAGIGVMLWRAPDGDGFVLATPRSSAGSFAHWLKVSAGIA